MFLQQFHSGEIFLAKAAHKISFKLNKYFKNKMK